MASRPNNQVFNSLSIPTGKAPWRETLSHHPSVFQRTPRLQTTGFGDSYDMAQSDEDGRPMRRVLLAPNGVWGGGKTTFLNRLELLRHCSWPDEREKMRALIPARAPTS